MPVAISNDAQDAATTWLSLDEVAARMRFPSRKALLQHLYRHPAPLFKRAGSPRYFMRLQDVDRLMVPIDLRKVGTEAPASEFEAVPAARTSTRPRSRPPTPAAKRSKVRRATT